MTPDFGPNFGPAQRRLYDALRDAGDVEIDTLFRVTTDTEPGSHKRTTQQKLGPYIGKLNRRLRRHGLRVRPGDRKHTYRLTVL